MRWQRVTFSIDSFPPATQKFPLPLCRPVGPFIRTARRRHSHIDGHRSRIPFYDLLIIPRLTHDLPLYMLFRDCCTLVDRAHFNILNIYVSFLLSSYWDVTLLSELYGMLYFCRRGSVRWLALDQTHKWMRTHDLLELLASRHVEILRSASTSLWKSSEPHKVLARYGEARTKS